MNRKLFLLLLCIMTLLLSSIVPGQENTVSNPDAPWHIFTQFETIFIGEELLVNVTGPDNSSFIIKFVAMGELNYSFRRFYRTDETGNWTGNFESFREGEEGDYSVQLIVDSILMETKVIEVIYNEDKAQWLAIEDIQDENEKQDRKDARQDEHILNQNRLYKKWIMYFFIPVVCAFTFLKGIDFFVFWPAYRLWFNQDKMEVSTARRGRWLLELIRGGTTSEDFANEFPGTVRVGMDETFEPGDTRVSEDTYGKTEEELEISRREKYYGKDWKQVAPYGEVIEDEVKYPDPWSRTHWLILILLITSISILISSIWILWYVMIPAGIILLIICPVLYFKKIKVSKFAFEEEGKQQ